MKILQIKTLEKGWWDKDVILFHAAFQCLTDYVEKEKPFEVVNWNSDDKHKYAAKEIKRLYKWWTEKRPARKDPMREENLTDRWIYCTEKERQKIIDRSIKLDEKWKKEDDDNLLALIKIRDFLWT